jgi:hypothetical protein
MAPKGTKPELRRKLVEKTAKETAKAPKYLKGTREQPRTEAAGSGAALKAFSSTDKKSEQSKFIGWAKYNEDSPRATQALHVEPHPNDNVLIKYTEP